METKNSWFFQFWFQNVFSFSFGPYLRFGNVFVSKIVILLGKQSSETLQKPQTKDQNCKNLFLEPKLQKLTILRD